MRFGEAIRYCFANCARFSGRGSRSQYRFFALFPALVDFAAKATADPIGAGGIAPSAVSIGFSLATLIPSLAAASRRLHDAA